MITSLDKAMFIMVLREQEPMTPVLGRSNVNQYFRAIEIAESFYMMLSEEGYHSVRDAIYWAHFSDKADLPNVTSEAVEALLWIVRCYKELNSKVAEGILDDLNLIKLNGYISMLNFLCKVRQFHTKPKSEQRTLAECN